MNLRNIPVSAAACLTLLAVGCGGGGAGKGTGGTSGGSGGAGGGGECAKLWSGQRTGTAVSTAVVLNGALILKSANTSNADLLSITQAPLVEDFDVTFQFEGFVSGGEGAFVQAIVSEPALAPRRPIVSAGIGSVPGAAGTVAGISAAFQPGDVSILPTDAKAGTFRFQRTGIAVSVTATPASGTAAMLSQADYGSLDLQVGLQIGNNQPTTIGTETSIKVTSFTVTGGGDLGVKSDTFDCNSLK